MQYNFENLKKVEITDPSMVKWLSGEKFATCFAYGGWIAGGFARALAQQALAGQGKMKVDPIQWQFREYFAQGGDIDVFFSGALQVKSAYEALVSPIMPQINGPFARNVMLNDNIKMQLVEKFIYAGIKQTFESFDFMNSCYAIRAESLRFYLVYHPEAWAADRKKQLFINHSGSPYTLSRMRKYLLYKGVDSIASESEEVFLEILISAAAVIYDKKYNFHGTPLIYSGVKFLYDKGLISMENIALFLGKFKIKVGNYGQTCDWALREIEQSARDTNGVYNKNLNEVSNAT